MVKILTFSKIRVSLPQIDVTPNYHPSSYNSSFSQLVPALVIFTNRTVKTPVSNFNKDWKD